MQDTSWPKIHHYRLSRVSFSKYIFRISAPKSADSSNFGTYNPDETRHGSKHRLVLSVSKYLKKLSVFKYNFEYLVFVFKYFESLSIYSVFKYFSQYLVNGQI